MSYVFFSFLIVFYTKTYFLHTLTDSTLLWNTLLWVAAAPYDGAFFAIKMENNNFCIINKNGISNKQEKQRQYKDYNWKKNGLKDMLKKNELQPKRGESNDGRIKIGKATEKNIRF